MILLFCHTFPIQSIKYILNILPSKFYLLDSIICFSFTILYSHPYLIKYRTPNTEFRIMNRVIKIHHSELQLCIHHSVFSARFSHHLSAGSALPFSSTDSPITGVATLTPSSPALAVTRSTGSVQLCSASVKAPQ